MSHLVLALLNPLAFTSFALLLAAFSLRKFPRVVCIFALTLLLVFGTGVGSDLLLQSLERPYEGLSVATAPTAEAIVVLGGYLRQRPGSARPIELGGSADRLWAAAQLYKAGKAPIVLLSGGNGPDAPPEAVSADQVIEQWGVPHSAILTETASRDTLQNAAFSRRILGNRRILLVTSAWHMRRATVAFERVGFQVIPLPADFITGNRADQPLLTWIPNAAALGDSSLAIKEWLGLLSYRITPRPYWWGRRDLNPHDE